VADTLKALIQQTDLVAITFRQTLEPVEGPDTPIFPATYPAPERGQGLDHNSAHPRHAATSVSAGRVTGRGRRRRAGGGRPTCASTWSNSAG